MCGQGGCLVLAQTHVARPGGTFEKYLGLGFLPLEFRTGKRVCNLPGKAAWKIAQKKRVRYSISEHRRLRNFVSLQLPVLHFCCCVKLIVRSVWLQNSPFPS